MGKEVDPANAGQTPANAADQGEGTPDQTPDLDPAALKATNERLLVESKKNRENFLLAKKELDTQKKQALEEQGKFKELYEKSAADLAAMKKQAMVRDVNFALQKAAEKAGFVKPESILKFGNQELVTYDENTGSVYGIEAFLESAKAEYPMLFGSQKNPVVNPQVPSANPKGGTAGKPLSALSKDEIMDRLRALPKH